VGHFPAAELEHDLDLHVFAEEINGVGQLDAEVMRVNLGAELDFLDLVCVLMLADSLSFLDCS